MLNFIYGCGAGILLMVVFVIFLMFYGTKSSAWDASKDNFQDEMMGYWKNTAKYQGSYLEEMKNQTLALQDILEEFQKFRKGIID
jgi:hypothetical protein